jgi:hypothetical protein
VVNAGKAVEALARRRAKATTTDFIAVLAV